MSWTAPQTWTTGQVVSAGDLNTDVRDNLLETAPAKAAAAGDLIYATGANAVSVLSLGTKGKHVVVNDAENAPVWVPGIDIIDRDLTTQNVVSTTDETSLYSHSIDAGSLGTTGGVELTLAGDILKNVAGTVTLRIKLGATTVLTSQPLSPAFDPLRYKFELTVWFLNDSDAALQKWTARFEMAGRPSSGNFALRDTSVAGVIVGVAQVSSTEDTASARTIDVTVQWSASNANLSYRKEVALLERITAA